MSQSIHQHPYQQPQHIQDVNKKLSKSASNSAFDKHQKKKEVKIKQREMGWNDSTTVSLPEYNSEKDPNCPRAVVREYNKTRKKNAEERAKKSLGVAEWINATMKKTFDNIPDKHDISFQEKAIRVAVNVESTTEVEILQMIIIRENLLEELRKLLKYQSDIDSAFSEIKELINAIRNQTIEIIEIIDTWKKEKQFPRPFLYRGENYLLRMMSDLSFLDDYEELGNYYGFYFAGNPLIFPGRSFNPVENLSDKPFYGIPFRRIVLAENIVHDEVKEFENGTSTIQNTPNLEVPSLNIGEVNMNDSMLDTKETLQGNSIVNFDHSASILGTNQSFKSQFTNIQSNHSIASGKKSKKKKQKIDEIKYANERIQTLKNDIDEMIAMRSHVEDKISYTWNEGQQVIAKIENLKKRKLEEEKFHRTAYVLRIGVEISLFDTQLREKDQTIKDLQRQSYFIKQEIIRKKKILKQVKQDRAVMIRQNTMKQKLMQRAKSKGLLATLLDVEAGRVENSESEESDISDQESSTVESKHLKQDPSIEDNPRSPLKDNDDVDERSMSSVADNDIAFGDDDSLEELIPVDRDLIGEKGLLENDSVEELEPDPLLASTSKIEISPEIIVDDVRYLSSFTADNGIIGAIEMCVNVNKVAFSYRVKKNYAVAVSMDNISKTLNNLARSIGTANYERDRGQIALNYARGTINYAVQRIIEAVVTERRLQAEATLKALVKDLTTSILSDQIHKVSGLITAVNDIKEIAETQAEQAITSISTAINDLLMETVQLKRHSSWQVIASACVESAITDSLAVLVSNLSPVRLMSMAYAENAVDTALNTLAITLEYRDKAAKSRPSTSTLQPLMSHQQRVAGPERLYSQLLISNAIENTCFTLSRPQSPEMTTALSFVSNTLVNTVSNIVIREFLKVPEQSSLAVEIPRQEHPSGSKIIIALDKNNQTVDEAAELMFARGVVDRILSKYGVCSDHLHSPSDQFELVENKPNYEYYEALNQSSFVNNPQKSQFETRPQSPENLMAQSFIKSVIRTLIADSLNGKNTNLVSIADQIPASRENERPKTAENIVATQCVDQITESSILHLTQKSALTPIKTIMQSPPSGDAIEDENKSRVLSPESIYASEMIEDILETAVQGKYPVGGGYVLAKARRTVN